MVGQGVNTTIASAEKRTQYPAHEADQDRAPEGASETVDMETMHELIHQEEHEGVHHKYENPEGENNEGRHQEKQDGTEERVEDAEEQRCADQGGGAIITNPADDRRSDHH